MNAQQLLTDLAVAERNMKLRSRNYSILFFNKVSDAFRQTHATSYFDLVEKDVSLALELHAVAENENLL